MATTKEAVATINNASPRTDILDEFVQQVSVSVGALVTFLAQAQHLLRPEAARTGQIAAQIAARETAWAILPFYPTDPAMTKGERGARLLNFAKGRTKAWVKDHIAYVPGSELLNGTKSIIKLTGINESEGGQNIGEDICYTIQNNTDAENCIQWRIRYWHGDGTDSGCKRAGGTKWKDACIPAPTYDVRGQKVWGKIIVCEPKVIRDPEAWSPSVEVREKPL